MPTEARSRLWWWKTRRILRIPAGEPLPSFAILTEDGHPMQAEDGAVLRQEDENEDG